MTPRNGGSGQAAALLIVVLALAVTMAVVFLAFWPFIESAVKGLFR